MMMIIPCTQCHKEGQFDVHLKFMYEWATCNLYHGHSREWTFYFCDIGCMFTWLESRDIKDQGIPCQDCRETGWSGGFESNGPCEICHNAKRVKVCQNP